MGGGITLRFFLVTLFAFFCGWSCIASGQITNVKFFVEQTHAQTSVNPPATLDVAYASVGGGFKTAGQFNSAVLNFPIPDSRTMNINGTQFSFTSSSFSSLGNLHVKWPFGTYTYVLSGNLNQSESINYDNDYFTNDIPAVDATTFNALDGMDPTAPFIFHFNSHTPNSHATDSWNLLTISTGSSSNVVFSSPFLPASTTSVTVPANTLLPGKAYHFDLYFRDQITLSRLRAQHIHQSDI